MSEFSNNFTSIVEAKGWLSIDSLYFDNALSVTIPLSRGYIAISKSMNCLLHFATIDIFNTDAIHNGIVVFNGTNLGHAQGIDMSDLESLQRFNLATYSKASMNSRLDGVIEMPKIMPNPGPTVDLEQYFKDMAEVYIGTSSVADNTEIMAASVFSDKIHPIDEAWFNLDYLRDVWFPNKRKFDEMLYAYLGLPAGDLV